MIQITKIYLYMYNNYLVAIIRLLILYIINRLTDISIDILLNTELFKKKILLNINSHLQYFLKYRNDIIFYLLFILLY